MEILYALLLCLSVAGLQALPAKSGEEASLATSLPSAMSQLIATSLLKSFNDIDGNQAHSPLGVTSILAVLAEASAGDTYAEFENVFGYAKERASPRSAFKETLARYQNLHHGPEPTFQTWLYIYRNFTAKEEFKKILAEDYFVQVKDINRDQFDWSEPNTSVDLIEESGNNSKDVIGFETLKRIKLDEEVESEQRMDSYGEEVVDKEASKFDREVDDKQYVEKPVIMEEIEKEKQRKAEENEKPTDSEIEATTVTSNEAGDLKEAKDEENETVQDKEKIFSKFEEKNEKEEEKDLVIDIPSSDAPQKVTIPLAALRKVAEKTYNDLQQALETQLTEMSRVNGARSLFNKDDIASGLSANSITGRSADSKTKMLLFNGLYYRGNWATPFSNERKDFFFMTNEDAESLPMMDTQGEFHWAQLKHLDAQAICIPYENPQYTMLLIVPNQIEGLHSVIEKLQPNDFKAIHTEGSMRLVNLTLPKFQIEETSRSESMLKGLGLRKIFSRSEADLSLLSEDKDMHVDEIVQFVNVRVDEGAASSNVLSSGPRLSRAGEEMLEMKVDRPFLYFVMDCNAKFIIASGKVYAPEYKAEQPVIIDIELEQA